MVSSRAFAGFVKLGLAAVGVAAGLAVMGGTSLAQGAASAPSASDNAPSASDNASAAAKAAAALPNTGPPPATDPAALDKGRQLFTDYGCGNCHTLGDAGATGHVGPALDGNPNITADFVAERVTNGQGMMPSFASQLTPDEITTVAAYVAQVAAK